MMRKGHFVEWLLNLHLSWSYLVTGSCCLYCLRSLAVGDYKMPAVERIAVESLCEVDVPCPLKKEPCFLVVG